MSALAIDGEIIRPAPGTAESAAMAAEINTAHATLLGGLRSTVDQAASIGQLLQLARPRWRGGWLIWLETHTTIRRRTAALYMELAVARAQMGEGPEWKSISNLGVAGAVAELRARRRKVKQAAEADQPSRHVEELAEVLLRAIRTYAASAPDLTNANVLSALARAGKAVRGHGLVGPPA